MEVRNTGNKIRDKAEYLLSIISHFAERKGLSEMQAYRYAKKYGGVRLIDEYYDIMHSSFGFRF